METKILYRPHRATVMDAMSEAKEFSSEKELREFLVTESSLLTGINSFDEEDIVIYWDENLGGDERIGWHNDFYVCVKRYGHEVYECPQRIGMCTTSYESYVSAPYYGKPLQTKEPCTLNIDPTIQRILENNIDTIAVICDVPKEKVAGRMKKLFSVEKEKEVHP